MRSVPVTYLTLLAFELAPSVKISNFEAHADMNIVPPTKGDAYKHIPRTSTIAASTTEDSKCSKFGV